jgi:hypothetical protein
MTSPWQGNHPPPEAVLAPQLVACEPLYLALMKTLHAASRDDHELPSLAAVVTVADLFGALAAGTGLLWQAPDLVSALRALADDLEARRDAEPPKPVARTLRDFFVSAKPPVEH